MAISSRYRQFLEELQRTDCISGADLAQMLGSHRENASNVIRAVKRANAEFAKESGFELDLSYREYPGRRTQRWYMIPRKQAEAFSEWYIRTRKTATSSQNWTKEWQTTVDRGYALVLANIQAHMEARGIPGTAEDALALIKIHGPDFPRKDGLYLSDEYRYEP